MRRIYHYSEFEVITNLKRELSIPAKTLSSSSFPWSMLVVSPRL